LSGAEVRELADKFAPIMLFDPEERTFPVNVEYFIDHSSLYRSRQGAPVLVEENVSDLSLASLGADHYLDNRLGGLDDDGVLDQYEEERDRLGYTVYYQIRKAGSDLLVQYWMFYVFNKGAYNVHEGDWEMVQVVLDGDLAPRSAMCSQHETGMRVEWSSVALGENSSNMKVHALLGSHTGSFYPFTSGRDGGDQGPGTVLGPSDYELIALTDWTTSDPNQPWLTFEGHWGEWGGDLGSVLGSRGPQGPMFRQSGAMWEGVEWGDALDVTPPPLAAAVQPAPGGAEEYQAHAVPTFTPAGRAFDIGTGGYRSGER
jgi:hypothetical protein